MTFPLSPNTHTARILLYKKNVSGAREVMCKIYAYAKPEDIDLKVSTSFLSRAYVYLLICPQVRVLNTAVQRSIRITQTTTFYDRSKSMLFDPINRRALAIGCGMQAFQQLCGFNTLMYYSATLFAEIGFNKPTAIGLIISGTNFLFTIVALKWIDSIGRRRIMLISAPGMIIGLFIASIAFHCA